MKRDVQKSLLTAAVSTIVLLCHCSGFGQSVTTGALEANIPHNQKSSPKAIPFDQFGTVAGKQYSGEGLVVASTPDGATLHCVFQRLDASVTTEGLWLVSTKQGAKGTPFRIKARTLGRDRVQSLPLCGKVEVDGKMVRFVRPKLSEEYSVGIDGLQQDFVIEQRPDGEGSLHLELEVDGAKAEAMVDGARLVLADGGRNMVYNRLKAVDARGKQLTAKLKVLSGNRLAVVLDDTSAQYPVRIDPTFSDANWINFERGFNGADGIVYATAVDSSGNLYIGGSFSAAGDVVASNIAEWNGSVWSALGSGINGPVYALAISGGSIIAGGTFTTAGGVSANNIAEWSGSSWSALGSGMSSAGMATVYALAVSGNNLYAGGKFTTAGGNPASYIAQWNGTSWSALGSGMNGWVYALAVSGSDLFAGGGFTTAGGISANSIAEWNGSSWLALGSGMSWEGLAGGAGVSALALSGGNLFAGGDFTSAGGVSATNIAEWNGTSWSALGSGISGIVNTLAVSGNNVFAGGNFTTAGGISANSLAQWNGSSWFALSLGITNGEVASLALSGNNLYIGGDFTSAGGVAANYIAKYQRSGNFYWSALGSGMTNFVYALAVSGNNLYAAGDFTNAGGVLAYGIAEWNGSIWSALGSGLTFNGSQVGQVDALAVSGNNLFAGGTFTVAGGVPALCIAQWNGSTWSALGSGIDGDVYALAASGNNLFVAGYFDSAGGIPANNIAQWNGSTWSTLSSGLINSGIPTATVSALAVSGNNLFAGGGFNTAGGTPANYIAEWNGSSWSALGSGMNSVVLCLAVSGNTLYAGGQFTDAGGVPASYIAQWNDSSWSAVGSGLNGDVEALAVSGNTLYAGGRFTASGGYYIAEWNGSSWSALNSGMNLYVDALAVSGTTLFAGGLFSAAGGVPANFIAQGNPITWSGSWSAFGSGTWNGRINALALSDNDLLYAGGEFTNAGGTLANYIAQWNGSSWLALGSGLAGGDASGPYVSSITTEGNALYVGGDFTKAGGLAITNIAEWSNAQGWSSLGATMNGPVNALAVSGGNLFAGGAFTMVNGVSANYIVEWNGEFWSAFGSGMNGQVNTLAASDNTVFAGGNFTTADGVPANCIAEWNGSSWTALGSGITGGVETFEGGLPTILPPSVSALAISGSTLFAGGLFTMAGGDAASDIAQWNGSTWSALGSGMSGQVTTLAVSGNSLYAGGNFTTAGGISASDVAQWNGSTWSALGSGIYGGSDNVDTLAVYGTSLFVAGSFSIAGNNVSPDFAEATINAPVITAQSPSTNVLAGSSVTFSVSASGPAPIGYEWYFNGTPIPPGADGNAAGSILTLNNLTTEQDGDYTVIVSDAAGATTSAPIVLTVYNPVAIVNQTTNISTAYGFTETMSVTATGTAVQYQWYYGTTAIPGATGSSLTLADISSANAGTYYVVVSNPVSSVKSQPILVSAFPAFRILPTGTWPGVNPPTGYWPNVSMTYTVEAGPTAGTIDYAVQEQISGGNGSTITVSDISDGGTFDANTSTINWGPFFDNSPRTLTYALTPSSGTTNWLQFNGIISINGANSTVSGNNEINLLPLDPADNGGDNSQPIDNYISINELTAYADAWKNGALWPVVPNPIPISYVTSAGVIWKQGEYYVYNPSLGAPPACWVNATPVQGTGQQAIASKLTSSIKSNAGGANPLDDSSSTAVCSMPSIYTNNTPFTVSLTVTPASSVGVYAVEDQIPFGWTATNFSTSGAFDSINNEVKYGPFFDNSARTLTYQITPATNATGTATFSGTASFDGLGIPITGIRQVVCSTTPPVFQQTIMTSKGLALTWSVVPTLAYQLQYTTNLASGNWINVGSVLSGTNSTMSVTNAVGPGSQGFYRIELVQ